MKILIVDDLKSRVDKIVIAIKNMIEEADIDAIDKANMAKQFLLREQYDLVIIDIHIPNRAGEPPEAKHGIDLIKYIAKNDKIYQPNHVLGITSDNESLAEIQSECQSENVFITGYDECSDSWLNIIEFSIKNIIRDKKKNKDLLIITTTAAEEAAILTSEYFSWSDSKRTIKGLIDYSEGVTKSITPIKSVACIRLTRMGMIDSAIITTAAIREFQAKVAIMTGICGGVPKRVNLGDVIVVTSSWDWQRGKYMEDKETYSLASEADQITLPDSMQRKLASWASEVANGDVFKRLTAITPAGNEVKIKVGSMVSGSAVVSSSIKVDEIAKQSRNLLGIDMEIFGFYSTMRSLEDITPQLIAVKSVCDLADKDKNDTYHTFCANLSAAVGIELAIKALQDLQGQ